MLWFKCAAMHDPVRPVIKKQTVIGWEAKNRDVDLVIESPLKGEELLRRMKGWFTTDVHQAVQIFRKYGKLKILDDISLVIETQTMEQIESLTGELESAFQGEAWIEHMPRKRLL